MAHCIGNKFAYAPRWQFIDILPMDAFDRHAHVDMRQDKRESVFYLFVDWATAIPASEEIGSRGSLENRTLNPGIGIIIQISV